MLQHSVCLTKMCNEFYTDIYNAIPKKSNCPTPEQPLQGTMHMLLHNFVQFFGRTFTLNKQFVE